LALWLLCEPDSDLQRKYDFVGLQLANYLFVTRKVAFIWITLSHARQPAARDGSLPFCQKNRRKRARSDLRVRVRTQPRPSCPRHSLAFPGDPHPTCLPSGLKQGTTTELVADHKTRRWPQISRRWGPMARRYSEVYTSWFGITYRITAHRLLGGGKLKCLSTNG
jgi:hypothetical protein